MKKVKFIISKPNYQTGNNGVCDFENEINSFIENKKIIDIKFKKEGICLSALIIYEEE